MRHGHQSPLLVLLAAPLLVAAGAAGATTTVTANLYTTGSVSDDIALTCRDVAVDASTGVLSATCNMGDAEGEAVLNPTTIDLDTVLYCASNDDDVDPILSIACGSKTSDYAPADWSVTVSSSGQDYHGSAVCRSPDDATQARSRVDLGDTTSGLENDVGIGTLAGR